MVNNPLIRPYFLEGVAFGGGGAPEIPIIQSLAKNGFPQRLQKNDDVFSHCFLVQSAVVFKVTP